MREEHLLTGLPEPTNQAYAIAKIAGIEMVRSYRRQYGFGGISLMPTNLYGPGDNFDPVGSHVLPGLLRRFHEAEQTKTSEVSVWGTGTPRREFLYVEDLADACVHVMNLPKAMYETHTTPMQSHINVGSGSDVTIAEVARSVAQAVGYSGNIEFDSSKPDGAPRKWINSSVISALGWQPMVDLRQGLFATYQDFLNNI